MNHLRHAAQVPAQTGWAILMVLLVLTACAYFALQNLIDRPQRTTQTTHP